MTDRPILQTAADVRAALAGRKTQTRRVLKPQPEYIESSGRWKWSLPPKTRRNVTGGSVATGSREFWEYAPNGSFPYAVGDRLWVRETHYLTDDGESEYAVFAADQGDVDEHLASMQTTMASHPSINWSKHLRLRPSIHMPRWASRLTLTVTDVRVQRLHDISEADAIAEGCERLPPLMVEGGKITCTSAEVTFRNGFRDIWNRRHGPGAWDRNDWVAAITFDVTRANIDQIGGAE